MKEICATNCVDNIILCGKGATHPRIVSLRIWICTICCMTSFDDTGSPTFVPKYGQGVTRIQHQWPSNKQLLGHQQIMNCHTDICRKREGREVVTQYVHCWYGIRMHYKWMSWFITLTEDLLYPHPSSETMYYAFCTELAYVFSIVLWVNGEGEIDTISLTWIDACKFIASPWNIFQFRSNVLYNLTSSIIVYLTCKITYGFFTHGGFSGSHSPGRSWLRKAMRIMQEIAYAATSSA